MISEKKLLFVGSSGSSNTVKYHKEKCKFGANMEMVQVDNKQKVFQMIN